MLIVVTCFVKFLKNTLDFKDVAKNVVSLQQPKWN